MTNKNAKSLLTLINTDLHGFLKEDKEGRKVPSAHKI